MDHTVATEAEYLVLTTAPGRSLLEAVASVPEPRPADMDRWRSLAPAEEVAAAIRLAEARRRGAAKFSRAEAMWLDPTGLEQATAEPVARHKAERFRGAVAADLCCGIGGDALALAAVASRVIAVDLDFGMTRRALWNAGVYGVADRLIAVRALAERAPIPAGAFIHIDPDRRAGRERRARRVEDYAPGLATLRALIASTSGGAIKLGPASDFEAAFPDAGLETEVVSLAGECKEATVWFGALASCRRRATVLPSSATWTDGDGPAGYAPVAEIGPWIFDPDPALVRSGLLDGFAIVHELGRAGPALDLLTGPNLIASPFLAPFAVREVLPLDLRRIRRLVADQNLGPLEIKTVRCRLRPEDVRRQLRPGRGRPATLFLLGGDGRSRAIWAERPALNSAR